MRACQAKLTTYLWNQPHRSNHHHHSNPDTDCDGEDDNNNDQTQANPVVVNSVGLAPESRLAPVPSVAPSGVLPHAPAAPAGTATGGVRPSSFGGGVVVVSEAGVVDGRWVVTAVGAIVVILGVGLVV